MRRFWLHWLISGGYTVLFFLWWGYNYGDGDQAEHLPFLFKHWNPALYQGDYFMDYASLARFNVRTSYVALLTFLADADTLPYVCFTLTVLSIWLGIGGAMAWGRSFFPRNNVLGWMAPFFSHFLFYRYWSLGDNLIAETSFISGTLPLAAGLWAMAWAARGHFVWAILITALSGVLHIIVGLHLLILLILNILLYQPARRWRLVFGGMLLFIAINFSFFHSVTEEIVTVSTRCEGLSYGEYFIRFRLPHHFVMSVFPVSHYLKFGFLLGGLLGTFLLFPLHRRLKIWIQVTLVSVFLLFLYFGLSEIGHWEWIYKTQWPKMTIWLSAGASVVLASGLESAWYEGLLRHRLLRVVPLMILGILLLKPFLQPTELLWPFQKRTDALAQAHDFIRHNTPLEALFVTDPLNDRFAIEAQRPLLTGYRAVWPDPEWACTWFKDFCRVYKVSPDSLQPHEKLRDLAAAHFLQGHWTPFACGRRADYALVSVKSVPSAFEDSAQVLYRNEAFAVLHWPGKSNSFGGAISQ
jgi:hypothetical protein